MTIFSSLVLATALQAAAPPAVLEAGTPAEVAARLSAAYEPIAEAGFSGIVVVTHDGEIIHEAAFGAANYETDEPFTTSTTVDMASIVKTYTGMMAAQLIADGRLSPDDTLADFFPTAPADKAGITLHQLLTHSSGLPGAVADDAAQIDTAELLDLAFGADLLFEPGTRYHYSNTAFSLVAAIIEQITGSSYEDYLLDEYLHPAGIRRTGYGRAYDAGNPPDDMAWTMAGDPIHDWTWGGPEAGWALIGNGGMMTTIDDLIAWRNAYNSGALISEEARGLQQSPHVQEGDGAPSQYGYGVVVEDHPQFGRIFWHNGGSGAFSAHWREYADTGYAVFAATNTLRVDADAAMLAATGGIFGVEIQIDSRAETVDWDDVDFDRNAATRLAGDFLDLAQGGIEADRRAFVENRMIQGLQDVAPMEGHFGMMDQIGETARSMALTGMTEDPDEGLVLIRLEAEDGRVMILEVNYELVDGMPRMSGIGVTD
ncbi:serine hydrolase domain-containing protein [Hyphobacterium marinum]|uniref:Serine hydrolase domain-containing protein n=1 Tax=Hyphobacterium marinum TaxID=3116574 RepID=A0ABU7LX41_9PROT|nr:serine hydrolase domain-containing protein [Hyphobacterium sp. Y6023]MEE2566090.1 serine hydrolase domain-containing protein [Hyphobacterium sp. Y6023]